MIPTRIIIAAVALAGVVLIGVGAGLALGAFDSGGDSGPPGAYTGNCEKYATQNMNDAVLTDPYVKGLINVGFKHGPDGPGAVALLKSLGTAYDLQLPFRDQAFVCVKEGYEDHWVAQIRALDWVEFAHTEGPTLCKPNCHLRH